jgi:hypothetical protein
MELRLTRKAQAATGLETIDRRARHERHVDEAGSMTGVELFLQLVDRIARRYEQIAVEPFELALDALVVNDSLDRSNRAA